MKKFLIVNLQNKLASNCDGAEKALFCIPGERQPEAKHIIATSRTGWQHFMNLVQQYFLLESTTLTSLYQLSPADCLASLLHLYSDVSLDLYGFCQWDVRRHELPNITR